MSGFGDAMSTMAAVNSAEAASQARAAVNASEERLESNAVNPFITFKMKEFETIPGSGFWGTLIGLGSKTKLEENFRRVSIKRSDIAFLTQGKDDFGTVYTKIYLEDGCNLGEEYLYVDGDMETVQNYINSK